ncbi:MAG: hypothetical protein M1834_005400 [Cirrosporium novae-zelandiae]|nr:MAG: hypothetical protein M1834_005400 [Cirrosporium novae-zelandiae]
MEAPELPPLPYSSLFPITTLAIKTYLLSQNPQTGQISGIGNWQIANGYTAICLHDRYSGTRTFEDAITAALQVYGSKCNGNGKKIGFVRNEFNDDALWWGCCLVAAWRAYGDRNGDVGRGWIENARGIQRMLVEGGFWVEKSRFSVGDMDMEGGVFWTRRPEESALNSITTGLFAQLTADLARIEMELGIGADGCVGSAAAAEGQAVVPESERKMQTKTSHSFFNKLQQVFHSQPDTHDKASTAPLPQLDIHLASTSLAWIIRCRLHPTKNLITDTINIHTHNLIDWTFTYTTGQTIGACVALSKLAPTPTSHPRTYYLSLATDLAITAMQQTKQPPWVTPAGILTEQTAYGPTNHRADQNNDAVGFKSILIRQLAALYEVLDPTFTDHENDAMEAARIRCLLRTFINTQFLELQRVNVNSVGQYGPWWAGPFDTPTSHSQMAVLDVMAAVMLVNR